MTQKYNLTHPKTQQLSFSLHDFENQNPFKQVQRLNYYACIWVKEGKGQLKCDFNAYEFQEAQMLFFAPYQPFTLLPEKSISGTLLLFSSDFFCIYKHEKEVACNGVLFNDIYEAPSVDICQPYTNEFEQLIAKIKTEITQKSIAQYDILVSYLKIFLVTASRLKLEYLNAKENTKQAPEEPSILQKLKALIEKHYREKKSAGEYANILSITTKALGKLTKAHYNKTITNLVQERIVIEAKRELYLTQKTVKVIAYELGFQDEYYFSRFFKNVTGVSPQMYRQEAGVLK